MTIASSVLQRAHSCPDLSAWRANDRPASALGQVLTRAQNCPASSLSPSVTPATVDSAQRSAKLDPNQFSTLFKQQAREALFAAAASPGKQALLRQTLDASSNAYAQREIDAFAKVYSQLQAKPDLSVEAQEQLKALAKQYTDLIIRDGLGRDRSAFDAWDSKADQQIYTQRSKLEHQLADFARQHTGGDFLQLGNQFMVQQVMHFIRAYVEEQLGGKQLGDETLKNLIGVVDQAAKQAFDALRETRKGLIERNGYGVGKLARDLDTVAVLPLLLRNILAGLPKDTVPPAAKPPAAEPTGPGDPAAAGPQQPAPGGITFNIGDIHIDNSRHINNSRRFTRQGGRGRQTPMAVNVRQCVNQRQNDTHAAQAGTGRTTERVEDFMWGAPPQTLQRTSTQAGSIPTLARDQAGGDDKLTNNATRTDASTQANASVAHASTQDDGVAATGSSVLQQTNAAGDTRPSQDFSTLQFRDGPLRNLPSPAYLGSWQFHSQDDRLPAERLFVSMLRDALEPHPAQPMQLRRDFDLMRNAVLPNDLSGWGKEQDNVLQQFAQGEASDTLKDYTAQLSQLVVKQLQAKNPLFIQLRSEAQRLARSTNLLNGGGNPMLTPFLSALAVVKASATTTSSSASSLRQMVHGVGTDPIARADAAAMTDGAEDAVTMAQQFRSVASLDLRRAGGAKLVKAPRLIPGTSPGAAMPNDAAKTGLRAQDNAEQTATVDTAVETTMKTGAALSPVQERREWTTEHSAADRDTLSQNQGARETSSPRSEAGPIRSQKPTVSATVAADASKDADSFAGLKLQTPRALYTLSTAASRQRQQQAGLFNAEKELLRACMDGVELQPNQPQAARAELAELRFKMVNGQHGAVSQDDAQKLRSMLDSNAEQLKARKEALKRLVGDMVCQNGMFSNDDKVKSAPPVVATVMEWLKPESNESWQDWAAQMRPARQGDPLKPQPVTLSTDGLHFDARNLRNVPKH
ncbi:hypothetical protein C2134_00610 [Chromobacterium sinusclupearum]|uniref:Salmonella invasion protein A N-terminal domain-containing protein n=1 Tax=Chromobacterium sinusclupearum TaxID=2077146 RepID=A0A2K4MU39_9NEIS|nr:hypothetical protein [Chromobacterium sinusclupearum]POB00604.1 hypothetical protein C2134_00610 [Chromobacterium sinusclupearum]